MARGGYFSCHRPLIHHRHYGQLLYSFPFSFRMKEGAWSCPRIDHLRLSSFPPYHLESPCLLKHCSDDLQVLGEQVRGEVYLWQ
jgi:hypothetical protein